MSLHGFYCGFPETSEMRRPWRNCQPVYLISFIEFSSLNSLSINNLRNSISPRVPMKVLELSLKIFSGSPRRAVKRFMASRQSSLVNVVTVSIWTAFVLKHKKGNIRFLQFSAAVFCAERSTVVQTSVGESKCWNNTFCWQISHLRLKNPGVVAEAGLAVVNNFFNGW